MGLKPAQSISPLRLRASSRVTRVIYSSFSRISFRRADDFAAFCRGPGDGYDEDPAFDFACAVEAGSAVVVAIVDDIERGLTGQISAFAGHPFRQFRLPEQSPSPVASTMPPQRSPTICSAPRCVPRRPRSSGASSRRRRRRGSRRGRGHCSGTPALRRPSKMGSSWARYVGSSLIAVQ